MPEATAPLTNGHTQLNGASDSAAAAGPSSTPLELLKAVKEVQERRVAVWREYDDAFDTFLDPSSSSSSTTAGPVNGSQNTASHPHPTTDENLGRGCAGCSTSTIPLTEDLLAQIMQITTQALIECGHRLRTIQTELAHSTSPELARLVDQIQAKENALLRAVVGRDQLRKTTLKPAEAEGGLERDDAGEAEERIREMDEDVKEIRAEIGELMQEIYAESVELQLAEG